MSAHFNHILVFDQSVKTHSFVKIQETLFNCLKFFLWENNCQIGMCIHLLFLGFPSHLGHHRALSRVSFGLE